MEKSNEYYGKINSTPDLTEVPTPEEFKSIEFRNNNVKQEVPAVEVSKIPLKIALSELIEYNSLAMRIVPIQGHQVQTILYDYVVREIQILIESGQTFIDYETFKGLRNHLLQNANNELSGRQM